MKVSNISLAASEQEIKEFFSFSGNIEYVEMQRLVIQSNSKFSFCLLRISSIFLDDL